MEADQVATGGDELEGRKWTGSQSQLRVERIAVEGNSDEQDASDQEIAVVLHVEKRDDPPSK